MKIKDKIEHGLHYHNGLKYYGLYKNGKEEGKWTIENKNYILSTCEFNNGDKFEGIFEKGIKIEGTLTYKNGNKFTCCWVVVPAWM